MDWIWEIFRKRYSNRYDGRCTAQWITENVLQHPVLYYATRTDDAFLIALISCAPWHPNELECHVIVTAADVGKIWQTIPLLRDSVEWAKRRNCVSWNYCSDTTHDIGPLMKRIGAKRSDRYQMHFAELGA
jgi:hypothetical protein